MGVNKLLETGPGRVANENRDTFFFFNKLGTKNGGTYFVEPQPLKQVMYKLKWSTLL